MARSRVVASMVVLMAALLLAAPVSASAPMSGAGTGAITGVSITSVRTADGNVIQERDLTGAVAGTLQGTFTEHVRGVIHPSGLVTFEGTITFHGAVARCGTGTLALGISGQGITGAPVTEAHIRVIDGGSNTIAAHGDGALSETGPALSYQLQYQC